MTGVVSRASFMLELLEDLTGQKPPFPSPEPAERALAQFAGDGIGHSQLNELLLLLGYDRVSPNFFQYLVDGGVVYKPNASIGSLEQLHRATQQFQLVALLFYGNVKFAFKSLSNNPDGLRAALSLLAPRAEKEFEERHHPIQPVDPISPEDTYYLGYLIAEELKKRLEADPTDRVALEQEKKRKELIERGRRNHEAYLTSDHLDVYVATSMRERHEYLLVGEFARAIFESDPLRRMGIRWFDPTQAYCLDRIDKGLAEALMLKRARCTLYLAQETDTLGKDSELASTLAQGKPVIAFVPTGDESYCDNLLKMLRSVRDGRTEKELILAQLQAFDSGLAWKDAKVRSWLTDLSAAPLEEMKHRCYEVVLEQSNRRARILKESHPLGVQVQVSNGVANGVIVARSIAECAELIKRVLTRTLTFDVEESVTPIGKYLFLREQLTKSIFRVVTGDMMLTNTFWNYYLRTT